MARHDQLQEFLGAFVGRRFIDEDRIDIVGEDVANGPDDHVALFIDRHGCRLLLDAAHDDLPEPQQVGHVARQLLAAAFLAGRPDDEPEAAGRVEFEQRVAQFPAFLFVFDLAGHADASERGHQDQVASGDADVGRERGALGADPFLDDLDEHFVAAFEHLLDRRLHAGAVARPPASGLALRRGPRPPRALPDRTRGPVADRSLPGGSTAAPRR